jgi:hypothetical protein
MKNYIKLYYIEPDPWKKYNRKYITISHLFMLDTNRGTEESLQ